MGGRTAGKKQLSTSGTEPLIPMLPKDQNDELRTIFGYSGFDSSLYRNVCAKRHFPQENATSHELQMAILESKPI
jgi:hypothetical protein